MTDFPAPPGDTPADESAGDFVVLARFQDVLEAQVLRELLVSEGLRATLGDAHTVQTNALWTSAMGGIRVMVPAASVPRARALMTALASGALALEGDVDPALPPPVVATDAALWNPDLAAVLSLVLTPAFGATLVWINARTLGDRRLRDTAVVWLALSVAAVAGAFWLARDLPPSAWHAVHVSILLMPFSLAWYAFGVHPQSRHVARRHGRRYVHRSLARVAVPTAIVLALAGFAGL